MLEKIIPQLLPYVVLLVVMLYAYRRAMAGIRADHERRMADYEAYSARILAEVQASLQAEEEPVTGFETVRSSSAIDPDTSRQSGGLQHLLHQCAAAVATLPAERREQMIHAFSTEVRTLATNGSALPRD